MAKRHLPRLIAKLRRANRRLLIRGRIESISPYAAAVLASESEDHLGHRPGAVHRRGGGRPARPCALVVLFETVLQAGREAAPAALHLVAERQCLLAPNHGALGLLDRTPSATLVHVPIQRDVGILAGHHLHRLLAHHAHQHAAVPPRGLLAVVVRMPKVLLAEDLAATIARKRQEVLLVASRDGAVRAMVAEDGHEPFKRGEPSEW